VTRLTESFTLPSPRRRVDALHRGRPGRRIEYARVTPNDTAGTVAVSCRDLLHGNTEVTVS
jgi:hypothetical protein